jgi:entericidin B
MKSIRAMSLLAIFALALAAAGLSACNTVEGAGKDIEATGDAIKDTARDAKK